MEIYLEMLNAEDAESLFRFETENRTFFERMVPSRGDAYYQYDHYLVIIEDLLKEQAEGVSYFYLIKDEKNQIVGRINLVDINNGLGHIGYRIGEKFLKQGIATEGLKLILKQAPHLGVHEIHAKTTHDNIGSQKVLTLNNFQLFSADTDFVHFRWLGGN
jgi:[ribosomal protein S5]-alanine N-acetyltransferase